MAEGGYTVTIIDSNTVLMEANSTPKTGKGGFGKHLTEKRVSPC